MLNQVSFEAPPTFFGAGVVEADVEFVVSSEALVFRVFLGGVSRIHNSILRTSYPEISVRG